jgi:hypothetical protein
MKEAVCSANAQRNFCLFTPVGYPFIWKQVQDNIKFAKLHCALRIGSLLKLF